VNNTSITKKTDSMGYVQFLRDEGTYAATVTAAGYRPCVMESYGAVCRTGAIYITTPPNAFLEWILDPTSETTDIWEWLTSMNMVGVLQIFILLAVCLALIKIAREFGG
jgi:hypothetical protein